MSRTTRWAVVCFALLAPLAGFAYAFPEATVAAGLDIWSVPELRTEEQRFQHQSDDLDARLQVSVQRLTLKQEIAEEVIAGRLSVRAAARTFHDLNASTPAILAALRTKYPHCGDEEISACNVRETIKGMVKQRPGAEAVIARLNAELALMKEESGGKQRAGE